MSTAIDLDDSILAMSTALEQTLSDGVEAFREDEVRVTCEKAVSYARTRHNLLIRAGYSHSSGKYKGWLFDPYTQQYPGQSSQYLAGLAHKAIQARTDRTRFMQSGTDTKTDQGLDNLSSVLDLLDKEIHPGGLLRSDRGTWEAARTTLNRANIFRTTTRCR